MPDTEPLDAIIIGGGPAGSTAAFRLARAGRRVLLLDAATFPRVKLCAGWVTPAVWRDLELDPAAYPHTLQPFSDVSLELGQEIHKTHWAHTASYGIIRCEFDDFLLRRAANHGARIRVGMRVSEIRREADGMVVQVGDKSFRAPWVIGAGGHHCPVARRFGAIDAGEAVVVARESETRVGRDRLRSLSHGIGTPELFAESDFRGYGWYFGKGDFLNIGIGCLGDGSDLHRRCDQMLARLRADGRLPADLKLEPFKGHAYAIHVRKPRVAGGKGWLLLGDAAGLARGISGEGIGPAVASAALAAQLLNQGRATEYAGALERLCGKGETSGMGRLAERMPQRVSESIARAICRTSPLRRRLIFEFAFGMGRGERI